MNSAYCQMFKDQLLRFLESEVDVHEAGANTCAIKTPFFDNVGDPIYLALHREGESLRIEDTGAIAGHLFTLGQHALTTPAFHLLDEITKAYNLTIDFDQGTVNVIAEPEEAVERTMDMLKAIITMLTAMPFIRVSPHRVKPAGHRLKTRIKRAYDAERILNLVQSDYHLQGMSGVPWPIDFHWWVESKPNDRREVYVVATDFNVNDPLVKANHVAALSIDAQRRTNADSLRVVIDHSRKDSGANEAISLLRIHSDRLGFRVFDFDRPEERNMFLRQSVREITEPSGSGWRAFWLERAQPLFPSGGTDDR